MKEYILKPNLTLQTVTPSPKTDKPAVARTVPPRQSLPTPVMNPNQPLLKLGLDVHLDFTMAVAQKDHAQPQAPRKFSRDALVATLRTAARKRRKHMGTPMKRTLASHAHPVNESTAKFAGRLHQIQRTG